MHREVVIVSTAEREQLVDVTEELREIAAEITTPAPSREE